MVYVDPDALQRFSADARATAREIRQLRAAENDADLTGVLPGSVTGSTVVGVGARVQEAVDEVVTRHLTMADIADGVRDNYVATDTEIATGFNAMSR